MYALMLPAALAVNEAVVACAYAAMVVENPVVLAMISGSPSPFSLTSLVDNVPTISTESPALNETTKVGEPLAMVAVVDCANVGAAIAHAITENTTARTGAMCRLRGLDC